MSSSFAEMERKRASGGRCAESAGERESGRRKSLGQERSFDSERDDKLAGGIANASRAGVRRERA